MNNSIFIGLLGFIVSNVPLGQAISLPSGYVRSQGPLFPAIVCPYPLLPRYLSQLSNLLISRLLEHEHSFIRLITKSLLFIRDRAVSVVLMAQLWRPNWAIRAIVHTVTR